MKKLLSLALLLGLLLGLSACGGSTPPTDTTEDDNAQTSGENSEPQNTEPEGENSTDEPVTAENYTIAIDVQDYGVITVALDGAAAPITVNTFYRIFLQQALRACC